MKQIASLLLGTVMGFGFALGQTSGLNSGPVSFSLKKSLDASAVFEDYAVVGAGESQNLSKSRQVFMTIAWLILLRRIRKMKPLFGLLRGRQAKGTMWNSWQVPSMFL